MLAGCQSTGGGGAATAPPVDAAMAQSGRGQHADLAVLQSGRALFVGRCARCHALPSIPEHTAAQWPGIVGKMAKRSGLKPDQRDAVLAYVLAARAQ